MPKKSYRSKLEELTAKLLTDAGYKFKYEHTKLRFKVPVRQGRCESCGAKGKFIVKWRTYLADFLVGPKLILESKGILGASERAKFLAIKASNPEWTVAFVFGADNKLNKRKEKRYSDWCREHDFEYGIKQLPACLLSDGPTSES